MPGSPAGQRDRAGTQSSLYTDYTSSEQKRNPDRIDFTVTSENVIIIKFYRADGRDHPLPAEIKPAGFDLAGALAWCERNGYTIRRWPQGARAFKGEPWPIRAKAQIRKRRDEVESLAQRGYLPSGFYYGGLDFALDM